MFRRAKRRIVMVRLRTLSSWLSKHKGFARRYARKSCYGFQVTSEVTSSIRKNIHMLLSTSFSWRQLVIGMCGKKSFVLTKCCWMPPSYLLNLPIVMQLFIKFHEFYQGLFWNCVELKQVYYESCTMKHGLVVSSLPFISLWIPLLNRSLYLHFNNGCSVPTSIAWGGPLSYMLSER